MKSDGSTHDVTMGSYPGAEVCELVGLFLLSRLALVGLEPILYRDDGLLMSYKPGKAASKQADLIHNIFNKFGLKLEILPNLQQVNFLDVTLCLTSGKFSPYCKPNQIPTYIHIESNHPKNVLKNIPIAVEKRLSNLSSDENTFNNAKVQYENALKLAGHKADLKYNPDPNFGKSKEKQKRKRNIIWYNPPFDKGVKTKIGNEFLKIIHEAFPPSHPLHQIFNKNTVKISYSTMPNMNSIISGANKRKLTQNNTPDKSCSCRENPCPLQGQCNSKNLVYKAALEESPSGDKYSYIGMTCRKFIERFRVHKKVLVMRIPRITKPH